MSNANVTEYDDYGYVLDDYGHQIGWCNSCGEEAEADTECCEDGEVVPYEGTRSRDSRCPT